MEKVLFAGEIFKMLLCFIAVSTVAVKMLSNRYSKVACLSVIIIQIAYLNVFTILSYLVLTVLTTLFINYIRELNKNNRTVKLNKKPNSESTEGSFVEVVHSH